MRNGHWERRKDVSDDGAQSELDDTIVALGAG